MTTALRIAQGGFGRVALLDMDKPLVPHAHSQCHVVFKASGPDSYFFVRGECLKQTEYSAILVNPWEPHFYRHDPSVPGTVYLALYIEPNWLASLHTPLGMSARRDFFSRPSVRISPRTRGLVEQLIGELLSLAPIPQQRLENMLFDLMIAVIEPFSRLHRFLPAPASPIGDRTDLRILRAIDFIKRNHTRALDMDRLAREAHYSRARFFVRFRQCTGMTPNVFVNMLRMETVCKRLGQGGSRGSLGQLAEELGFSDQANFTRFVRDHSGVTPSQYRRVVDLYESSR